MVRWPPGFSTRSPKGPLESAVRAAAKASQRSRPARRYISCQGGLAARSRGRAVDTTRPSRSDPRPGDADVVRRASPESDRSWGRCSLPQGRPRTTGLSRAEFAHAQEERASGRNASLCSYISPAPRARKLRRRRTTTLEVLVGSSPT